MMLRAVFFLFLAVFALGGLLVGSALLWSVMNERAARNG